MSTSIRASAPQSATTPNDSRDPEKKRLPRVTINETRVEDEEGATVVRPGGPFFVVNLTDGIMSIPAIPSRISRRLRRTAASVTGPSPTDLTKTPPIASFARRAAPRTA